MKQHDQIKLDMISNINETIIDEVTDRKITLSPKLNRPASRNSKQWIAIGSIAASLALFFGIFFVLIVPMMGTKVPVYQGMTIRTESAASVSTDREHTGISLLSANYGRPAKLVPLGKSNGTPNGVANGHHKEDDDKLQNKIKDLVTIEVIADDEVRYYVKPGETFIIEIHIDNPKDYEIQSFTLNGKKYANYMFKEGSTMELLLLEVTAPSEPGYVEYTIDAIKYIDGTEIKDVDMSNGDKSVKAGIAYPEAPSAAVTSQSISTTSAELSIRISDMYSLIGNHELIVYLSDGEKIVDSKPLAVGDNTVVFNNLLMSTTYEYGVATTFDLVDGRDLHMEWLLTNTFTTAGAFGISNAEATQDSISFEVNRIGEVGTITAVSIYDAATDELVEMGNSTDIRAFSGLLSNHTYDLYIDFVYTVNGEEINDWVAVKGITTAAKTAPTLAFSATSADQTSVSYAIETEDPDGILHVTKVELIKDGESMKDNGVTVDGKFDGILSNNIYTVKVTYSYDLNDGQGEHTESVSAEITTEAKTAPVLTFGQNSADQTSLTYSVDVADPDGLLNVTNVELLKGDEIVQENSSALEGKFESLLSNNTYTVKVVYSYDLNDGKGVHTKFVTSEISTKTKKAPTVKISQVGATDTAVSGTYAVTDKDMVCTVVSVELYKGETLVQSTDKTEFIFSDLNAYTDYEIRVTYTYDLNDGAGAQTKTKTYAVKTSPALIVDSFKVLNTAAVEEGESIRLQINLQNPSRLIPTSIVINGETYSCSTASAATVAFVDIVVKDQFEGGDTELTIESIQTAEMDKSRTYTTPIRENNAAQVFIKSRLEIMGVEVAVKDDNNYVQRDYVFPEDEVYAIVTLLNKTGYTVESINGATEAAGDLVKIDQEHYAVKFSPSVQYGASITYRIREVVYNNGDGSQSVSGNVFTDSSMLYLQGTKEIRTAEDLLHMNEGYYYVLQNDIDLSGRNWTGGAFAGAFEGNGYAIENMTYIGRVEVSGNGMSGIGLFRNGSGSIQNLTLKAVNLVIDFGPYQEVATIKGFVGGFIGASGDVSFKNCSIDKDSIISASNALVGGFVGGNVSVTMENCTNNATVSGDFLTSGFVGSMGCDETKFINCINNGDIIGKGENYKTVGFVFQADKAEFVNCINAGGVPLSCGFSGQDATYTGCINVVTTSEPPFGYSDQTTNSYNLGDNVTVAELNSKSFYTETLGWDEEIWNLDDLDIENDKFPTLK